MTEAVIQRPNPNTPPSLQETGPESLAFKRRQRIRNYLVAGAVVAFVVFVYVLTWVKIANKSF